MSYVLCLMSHVCVAAQVVKDIINDYVSKVALHMAPLAEDESGAEVDAEGLVKYPMAHLTMPFKCDGKPAIVIKDLQQKQATDTLKPGPYGRRDRPRFRGVKANPGGFHVVLKALQGVSGKKYASCFAAPVAWCSPLPCPDIVELILHE